MITYSLYHTFEENSDKVLLNRNDISDIIQ